VSCRDDVLADLNETALLVGLAVALAEAIKWLAKALMRRNGRNDALITLEHHLREHHEDANHELLKDIQIMFAERDEKIRDIVRQEMVR